ncbi:PC-esterase domain-containing protein 1B-like [Apostichopus japonicus]|uniref:PC-esterase domain-containing protein 1B-like n=1 Tax=Stichopus japonicus TaxID=307972 RepID=UPI003AB7A49B
MSLFLHEDVKQLLYNKFVVIIGDSVHRGIYKDLVCLLQGNEFLSRKDLKAKGEETFMNDRLIEGGMKGVMTNGINYREVRQYLTDTHLIRFYFVTRIHNSYWREVIFRDLCGEPKPDVIVMNSCLWDISRYGPGGMHQYKENLEKTFQTLTSIVSEDCICIWDTALPVANKIKGGFLLPELSSLCDTLRLDVLEGNYYARQLAVAYDIHVLDLNYFFRSLMGMQVPDGVHWNFRAHRRFTNLLLCHLAKIWNLKLPYHQDVNSKAQQQQKKNVPQKSVKKVGNPMYAQNIPVSSSYIHATQKTTTSTNRGDVPPQVWHAPQNQLYTSLYESRAPNQPITQSSLRTFYQQVPIGRQIRQPRYLTQSYPYVAGPSANRWVNPNHAGPYQSPYYYDSGQGYSYFNQYAETPQSRYHWYPDGSARRQQRMLADRQQEIVGAMTNYASSQWRVQ